MSNIQKPKDYPFSLFYFITSVTYIWFTHFQKISRSLAVMTVTIDPLTPKTTAVFFIKLDFISLPQLLRFGYFGYQMMGTVHDFLYRGLLLASKLSNQVLKWWSWSYPFIIENRRHQELVYRYHVSILAYYDIYVPNVAIVSTNLSLFPQMGFIELNILQALY